MWKSNVVANILPDATHVDMFCCFIIGFCLNARWWGIVCFSVRVCVRGCANLCFLGARLVASFFVVQRVWKSVVWWCRSGTQSMSYMRLCLIFHIFTIFDHKVICVCGGCWSRPRHHRKTTTYSDIFWVLLVYAQFFLVSVFQTDMRNPRKLHICSKHILS